MGPKYDCRISQEFCIQEFCIGSSGEDISPLLMNLGKGGVAFLPISVGEGVA